MKRITQAILVGAVAMGLVACSDMPVQAREPAVVPESSEVEAEADAEEAEAFGEEARGRHEDWTSYVYYLEQFEGRVGHEWSRRRRAVTPSGRRFLGPFVTSETNLKLKDLPRHDAITLSFDLYVIGTWGGNPGPDLWRVKLVEGPVLLRTSFSSVPYSWYPQAYPDWYPGNRFPGLTGAVETGTLGYPGAPDIDAKGDAVYRLTFTVPHDDDRLAFNFRGFPTGREGSWGLDNVKVTLWRKGGDPDDSGADLSVKISANRDTVGSGEDVVYTVQVTNKGPGIATDVLLGTGISDHFNLTGVECGKGTETGSGCDLGTLAPGASVTSRFTVNVCCFGPGETRLPFFIAEVESSSTDPDPDDNRAEVRTPIVGDPR